MIVIMSGKMQIPEEDRFIGFIGDNLHSTKQFLLENETDKNCIYRLYLTFDDGTVNYLALDSKVENGSTLLTWTVLEEHIFKSGIVNAQIKCFNPDGEVYYTTVDYFIVEQSVENTDSFAKKDNAEFLRYERELNAIFENIRSGSVSLVPCSRKIAGINLVDDISVDELYTALNMYPVLNTMYVPTTKFKGNIGQLCVGDLWSEEYRMYICVGAKDGNYTWKQIGVSGGSGDISQGGSSVICSPLDPPEYASEDYLDIGALYLKIIGPVLYILRGKQENENSTTDSDSHLYIWQEIAFESQLENYVPASRKIAGLDLTDNITTAELNSALGIVSTATENLFDHKESNLLVGYTTTSGAITDILDTLEFSAFNTANVKEMSTYTLYSRIIPVSAGENYLISESYAGYIRFYNAQGLNVSGLSVASTAPLPTGENGSVLTIPEGINYMAIAFMNSAHIDYSDFYIIRESETAGESILNSNIKVSYNQLVDVPRISEPDVRDVAYGTPVSLNMSHLFAPNKKVVFIGDSITHGLGSTGFVRYTTTDSDGNTNMVYGDSAEYGQKNNISDYKAGAHLYSINTSHFYEALSGNGYAHKLINYLKNKFGCTAKNYGMCGNNTSILLNQTLNSSNSELDISGLPTDDNGNVRVFQALTKGFDTVVIMIGTNDRKFSSIDTFSSNLNYIVNYLKNTSKKEVVLMSSVPVVTESENLTMSQIDETIKTIAQTYEVPFVSLYNGMHDYVEKTDAQLSQFYVDGIHPNDEGYNVMEAMVCDALGICDADKVYVDDKVAQLTALVESLKDRLDQLVGG